MKGVVIAVCLFLVMVTGIVLIQVRLDAVSREITAEIQSLAEQIEHENWGIVRERAEALEKRWGENAKWIAMVIDHSEMDLITVTLAELKEYARYGETPELMAEVSTLCKLIEHIPRKEAPILENIF